MLLHQAKREKELNIKEESRLTANTGRNERITKINTFLQQELRRRGLSEVTAIEGAEWLERAGILKDSKSRPGLPLRNLLRAKKITGQRQEQNRRWFIDRLSNYLH